MQFATLLFYAATTFFLGLVALATGGDNALQVVFAPNVPVIGGDHEPWRSILMGITFAFSLTFLLLALYSLFVRASDTPATASDIRDLVVALERREAATQRDPRQGR
jgi:H+/Cl- antiporter ClcA